MQVVLPLARMLRNHFVSAVHDFVRLYHILSALPKVKWGVKSSFDPALRWRE